MSSIDIGKIKFTWRGNYDVATTYEAEDIVYSSGSTWICVATSPVTGSAPSPSNPDWNKISQGSDLGSLSGLSAGDFVYFDGNEFTRIASGAAGQYLRMGANNVPYWGEGSRVKFHYAESNTATGNITTWTNILTLNIMPMSAESKFFLLFTPHFYLAGHGGAFRILYAAASTGTGTTEVPNTQYEGGAYEYYDSSGGQRTHAIKAKFWDPQTDFTSTGLTLTGQAVNYTTSSYPQVNESNYYWSQFTVIEVIE